jgi:hypothetical protein
MGRRRKTPEEKLREAFAVLPCERRGAVLRDLEMIDSALLVKEQTEAEAESQEGDNTNASNDHT